MRDYNKGCQEKVKISTVGSLAYVPLDDDVWRSLPFLSRLPTHPSSYFSLQKDTHAREKKKKKVFATSSIDRLRPPGPSTPNAISMPSAHGKSIEPFIIFSFDGLRDSVVVFPALDRIILIVCTIPLALPSTQ